MMLQPLSIFLSWRYLSQIRTWRSSDWSLRKVTNWHSKIENQSSMSTNPLSTFSPKGGIPLMLQKFQRKKNTSEGMKKHVQMVGWTSCCVKWLAGVLFINSRNGPRNIPMTRVWLIVYMNISPSSHSHGSVENDLAAFWRSLAGAHFHWTITIGRRINFENQSIFSRDSHSGKKEFERISHSAVSRWSFISSETLYEKTFPIEPCQNGGRHKFTAKILPKWRKQPYFHL